MRGISEMKGNAKSKAIFLVFLSIFLLSVTYSAAQQFGLGVGLQAIQINQSQKVQIDLPRVDVVTNISPNITINIPISYLGSGLRNITIGSTTFGFSNPINISINESGVIKIATVTGNDVSWEANLSAGSAVLVFDVLPPTLSEENITIISNTLFVKNFTISSVVSFVNVSVTLKANATYGGYTLYFLAANNSFENKTDDFNLNVTNDTATFYGFNTSEQRFAIVGTADCTESWSCTAFSDSANSCGTRTCTDANSCGTENDKPTETVACPSGAAGLGGSGGGGGVTITRLLIANFQLSDSLIREKLRGDAIVKKTINVKNIGTKKLTLTIDFSGVIDFVITPKGLAKFEMELAPDEEKSFDIIIFGSGLEAGVHSGNIVVSAEGIEKRINLVLEYEAEEPIFDVEIKVPESYSKIFPGERVFAEIRLFNLRGVGKVDVKVKYSIKNSEGTTVTSGSTVIAVETQASFVRSLSLPSDIEPGSYIFSVEARFDGLIGVGSDVFEVVKRPTLEKSFFAVPNILIFGTGLLILMLTVLISLSIFDMFYHHKVLGAKAVKKEKPLKMGKLSEEKPLKTGKLSEKNLKKQLKLLEESFESGLISARAYINDKTKIEKLLKKYQK